MDTADALNRLNEHQALALSIVDRATEMAQGDPAVAQVSLARMRWELMRTMKGYQLFKHNEIFDPAIRGGSPLQMATAQQMKTACLKLGEEFQTYVVKWSAVDVVHDWDRYKPAMLKMADTIRRHIARERREIGVFLSGSERTRQLRG